MELIKIKKGDKVVFKKPEKVKILDEKDKEEYKNFVGKTLTVKQILKTFDDGIQKFEVEEDEDLHISDFISLFLLDLDCPVTKAHTFSNNCVERVVNDSEEKSETKENMSRVMSDFIGFLNTHNINGTALYQEFKKEVKVSE